jgi:hypothetical protein
MKGYMTKEKFLRYLLVRNSGKTNMFDVRLVGDLTGLSKDDLIDIMKNYGSYEDKYLKVSE